MTQRNYKLKGNKTDTGKALVDWKPCYWCGKLTANLKQKCKDCLGKDDKSKTVG